jgi:hypothetical protein
MVAMVAMVAILERNWAGPKSGAAISKTSGDKVPDYGIRRISIRMLMHTDRRS